MKLSALHHRVQDVLSETLFIVSPVPAVGMVGISKEVASTVAHSTRPWWQGMPPRLVRSNLNHMISSSVVVYKDIPGGVPNLPADMGDHVEHIVERLVAVGR